MNSPVLMGDIGATLTRLALYEAGHEIGRRETVHNAQFDSLGSVVTHYLARHPSRGRPHMAVLAVAGPVFENEVTVTNLGWRVSATSLKLQFGFESVHLINDLCAVAMAVPLLTPADRVQIGEGTSMPAGTIGVLAPGTGLGVAGLVRSGQEWVPVPGEGGHATLSARGEREQAILQGLEKRFGHVSAERVLSGPGIENLYSMVAERHGVSGAPPAAPEIGARALSGTDTLAVETLDLFFLMLGTVAGNLALTLGATGGIFLAGGVLPKLRAQLVSSGFRERFADKGRYRRYLEAIPTFLITGEVPALIGLRDFVDKQR